MQNNRILFPGFLPIRDLRRRTYFRLFFMGYSCIQRFQTEEC